MMLMNMLINESESIMTNFYSNVMHFDYDEPLFSSHMMTDKVIVHGLIY